MKTYKAWYTPAMLLFLSMLITNSLNARTVALWKLDYEPVDTALNARCLIDPANDLLLKGNSWNGPAVDSWTTLPPNPDTTEELLASADSRNAVWLAPSTSCLTNSAVSTHLNVTNSFTVEGWVYRSNNPTGTGWYYLVGNHMGGAGRWILSLRSQGTAWILYVDSKISDVAFPVANDPASTNLWRHLALTYDRDAGSSQQGVWELFVDSQSYGSLTNSSRPATISASDSIFSLGGRPTGSNTGQAMLDYWRVSDTVLATNEFLNAGTYVPETETIPRSLAYWRFDGDANGFMNTEDFIGDVNLYGNLDTPSYATTIQPATIQAFEGQPANSAISLPNGNGGSTYSQASGAMLQTPDLGTHLEITNNFTVEGWIYPQIRNYDATVQYIANTRISTKGWAFALKKIGDTRKLVIFAEDDNGVQLFDQPLSGDISGWTDTWKHLALVYDATSGTISQGVWSCYLDGELQGSVTNSRVVAGSSSSQYFHLGGRVGDSFTFSGYLDCWRTSKSALTPGQFMNATTGATAASNVLALWPLNSDGVYLDATDIVGSYDFNVPVSSTYKTTANTDQAVTNIPNPDATTGFKGDPSANPGSILFNTPANGAARAYLSSQDLSLRTALILTNSFTFEGWFNRTQNPGGWQLLFATSYTAPNPTTGGMQINLTHRTNGYVLYVTTGTVLINDVAFAGSTDDGTTGVWRHLALVYDADTGNGTWTLYINGILQGSIENGALPAPSRSACIYLGGRPWSANSFIGAIDSLRLSKGVLTTNQFLNFTAPAPAPVTPKTVAYWKLDSDGTTLNASSQVEPRYSFITDANAPSGSTAQFQSFVSVPDTSEDFIGDPSANAGSASFSADYLRVQNLGNRVDLDNPFTVEGWLYWNNDAATAVQTIAGTRFDAYYGWKLMLDKSGTTPAFRILCQTPVQTAMLDATFDIDAATLAGDWHHLALTYTPRLNDTGTWELFVDGSSVGRVVNRFYPTVLHQSHWFMLGGCSEATDPFDGLLDCWRISEGALEPEQFLYLGYSRGTLILVQ